MKASLTTSLTDDGILIITFDRPDRPVNALSSAVIAEFGPIVDRLEQDEAITAAVFRSGKPDNFIVGADVDEVVGFTEPAQAIAFVQPGQEALDRMARCPKPVVAAVHGPCLGGGYEVAQACAFILATDHPRTSFGQLEVRLGLFPAGGGPQRLPRRTKLATAVDLLVTGRTVRPREAQKLGLIDAVVPPFGLDETALDAVRQLRDGRLAPRRFRPGWGERFIRSRLGRGLFFAQAAKRIQRQTRGNYPAPPAILEAIKVGLAKGVDAGLAVEREKFGQMAVSPEAKALIGLFHAQLRLKKIPPHTPPMDIKKVGVLGGGFMGAGVAAAGAGRFGTVVVDVSLPALGGCYGRMHRSLSRRVKSGANSAFDRDRLLAGINLTTDLSALASADLIVEALPEDGDLKRRVLAEVEALVSDECVIASNTSSIPIAELAAGARRPERFVAAHFFPPADGTPLLEAAAPPGAAPETLAAVRVLAAGQDKAVLAVKDGPGRYTTRVLARFLAETLELLSQGVRATEIDRVAQNFGFVQGPVSQLDRMGLDVAAAVSKNLSRKFADRLGPIDDHLTKLVQAGFLGQKNGRGFYRYDVKKRPRPADPRAARLIRGRRRHVEPEEIRRRLVLAFTNEAASALQEGVVDSARQADWGTMLGLGWPPFTGGPFRWLDADGLDRAVGCLYELAEKYGKRFEPSTILVDKARSRRPKFYD